MSADIAVRELRTLSVSADGTAFRIGMGDDAGSEIGLVSRSDALQALMLSLFRAGDVAFKRLLDDASARLVYPVETCGVQLVPGTTQLVLALRTTDGFEAAFAVAPETLGALAELVLARPRLDGASTRFN